MKPVKTPGCTSVLKGEGCQDLPVRMELGADPLGAPVMRSWWAPTAAERRALADGAAVCIDVFSAAHPPIVVGVESVEEESAPPADYPELAA